MAKFKHFQSKPNHLYAIISVALVLFLLGFFGFIVVQGQQLIAFAKEQVEIIIELRPDTANTDIDRIRKKVAAKSYYKVGSLEFITRAQGAEMMKEEFGDEFMKLNLPNPLYDIITFNVKADYLKATELSKIRSDLKTNSFINDVFYQESLVNSIAHNIERISYYGLGSSLFFIIVAITLVYNTVKLSLFSNRFIIKNMELVGASWQFISRPYIRRSFRHGLASALIAIGFLVIILAITYREIPELGELNSNLNILLLFLLLIVLGVGLTTISTWMVVKKYLKMRVDDLY